MHKVNSQPLNLRSLDLNLLVILHQLLQCRQITEAAARLNMSQPAVSRALQRLRQTFDDPLLVRTSLGYDLSPRARAIAADLAAILQGVERIVATPDFDPATAAGTLNIYGVDPDVISFMPSLFARIQRQAPGITVKIRSEPRDHFELLDSGEVHLALTAMAPTRALNQYHGMALGRANPICIMRRNHPLADKPLTLERYLSASHGLITVTGQGPGAVDAQLASLGKYRRVALQLSNFAAVAAFCEGCDLLFVLPENIARSIAKGREIRLTAVPEELAGVYNEFSLFWHERHHKDPLVSWVRGQLRELLEETSADPE